jgi:hypothetical protein
MVGLGSRAIDIQRKMPRLSSSINENGNTVDVLAGTDFIQAVTADSTGNQPGDILFKQEISPSVFLETRLKQFADLYQRYRFKRIVFLYEPIANATQSGQVLGYADFDVDNQLTLNSPENLSIAAAHQGEAITQIWEPMLFDMGQVFTFTDLYTEAGSSESSDPRLSIQGVFYLIAASVLQGSIPLGNIYVDYEIEFSIPFLSAQVSSSRQSHGFIAATAAAFSGDVVQTSAFNVRSARGPVVAVDYATSGQTLAFSGCRPGDIIYLAVVMNTTNSSVAVQHWNTAPSSINCTTDLVNFRQLEGDGYYSWAATLKLTVQSSVGTGLASITWNSEGASTLAAEMNFSWVLDPAPVTLRGLRRQALERDHARLQEMEDQMAKLQKQLAAVLASPDKGAEQTDAPKKRPSSTPVGIATKSDLASLGSQLSSRASDVLRPHDSGVSSHGSQADRPERVPYDRYDVSRSGYP